MTAGMAHRSWRRGRWGVGPSETGVTKALSGPGIKLAPGAAPSAGRESVCFFIWLGMR